ncbi:four helix bundle protein [Marixanthomonas spongiae]|uniref:Four helix bundle protein n=1 Tax=Marixanthomonas spongiae TaxID=2174845 RepID=A0A2U0I5R2_9FLAO|nr:four helix bundle protein [Marixanthomonas spongiae]PVW16447.1 four helix bundle protein [Marixanthomonas spongiae]
MAFHFKFEDLQVYQKALDFVDLAYETAQLFPKSELYILTSQYKRAALSIALNTAEGHGDSNAQFNRFLQIAKNSVKECVVCSTIARRQNYITQEQDKFNRAKLAELSKMIGSLQKYLKK